MKNAIILHGYPHRDEYYNDSLSSQSNSHWLPWLQRQLMLRDMKADTPEIFKAYEPHYDQWVREVERYDITTETTLVGHSMGGGFWLQYLSEHPKLHVDKVVLVAPWLNVNKEEDIDFFNFTLDPRVAERTSKLHIFESDNDHEEVQNSIGYLKRELLGAEYKQFHDYGHFTFRTMKTDAFPELADAILA